MFAGKGAQKGEVVKGLVGKGQDAKLEASGKSKAKIVEPIKDEEVDDSDDSDEGESDEMESDDESDEVY